jgi:polysaccharide export outer membrane protein
MLDVDTPTMEVPFQVRKGVLSAAFALLALATAGLASAAPSPDYHIRVGDTVSVTVYGEAALTQPTLRVLPGGAVAMPLAGDVLVAGLTPPGASAAIARKLQRYLRDPKVTVAVISAALVDVLVLGNVKTPGKYSLQPESRLTDALAAAGGLGPVDGQLPMASLRAADGTVSEVSLQKLLQQGDVSGNVPVSNEMTIVVTAPLTMSVQVFGAVDHPGDVTLHEGDRLLSAIARAGTSPTLNPDLNRVTLRRIQADGTPSTQVINLYEIVKGGDLKKDIVLQKGDIVFIPQAGGKHDLLSPIMGILFGLVKPFGL